MEIKKEIPTKIFKAILIFLITITALLSIANTILFYYEYNNLAIIGSGFIIGPYIFACIVSDHKYTNYIIEPTSFNLRKFIKIIFMPSIVLSIFTKIIHPEIADNLNTEVVIAFIESNLNLLLKQEVIFIALPLIVGILSYFFINFIIYWYLIVLWNLLIFLITYS